VALTAAQADAAAYRHAAGLIENDATWDNEAQDRATLLGIALDLRLKARAIDEGRD